MGQIPCHREATINNVATVLECSMSLSVAMGIS